LIKGVPKRNVGEKVVIKNVFFSGDKTSYRGCKGKKDNANTKCGYQKLKKLTHKNRPESRKISKGKDSGAIRVSGWKTLYLDVGEKK